MLWRMSHIKTVVLTLALTAFGGGLTSCIQPPLHLPAEELLIDLPFVQTEMSLVWNLDAEWQNQWHYPWDTSDDLIFGKIEYPKPESFEVRRYFLGDEPATPHTQNGMDSFPVVGYKFRRAFMFGYYDMLLWSNVITADGSQVLRISESDLDNTVATTSVTRSVTLRSNNDEPAKTALYNQPEIFYSSYPRDIFISNNSADYDYYDEENKCWVKHLECSLQPLVYIYLVQIIIHNNINGRVSNVSGDTAISALASSTNVNTGHTSSSPCLVYFNTRMKKDVDLNGEKVDIIGGKLTTFGLCDMSGTNETKSALYQGSMAHLNNYLIFELGMSGGSLQQQQVDVTEQLQSQCHGGVITIHLNAQEIENPRGGDGEGSMFNPVVDDYNELVYEIPM